MTIAKLRALSKYGVNTDVDPFNLPPEAWSMAVNARFRSGSIERAPVFRRVPLTLSTTSPRFLSSHFPASGFDTAYIGWKSGRVSAVANAAETNVSIGSYADSDSEEVYTACALADVVYINRNDRVPWSRRTTDSTFLALSNWTSTHRAKILRACNGALCAFGVTKAGTYYPTMVKTSEFATVNAVPTTWDYTDPTTNATENILAEMEGPITDASNFGQKMCVYGLTETWLMTPDTGSAVWDYRRIFNDAGALSANCSVEVDSKQFVFGLNDIWMHDGVSKQSVCDQRVRKFIYSSLNIAKANRCFVQHDRTRKELRFNYVSGDGYVGFSGAEGCNRSAVLNLADMTWTFDDLPFVFGATEANTDVTLTYASVTSTYDTIGSTYLDQEDSRKKVLLMVGDSNTAAGLSLSLYAIDEPYIGSVVPYTVDTAATKSVTLERDGIDLDELPDVEDLQGYKVLSSIFPQARFQPGAASLEFSVGGADNYNSAVSYSDYQTYDANTYKRCDFNVAGRFLFVRMRHVDTHYFKLTGLDLDLMVTGGE